MLLLNRKNHCAKASVGIALGVIVASHIAAEILLCKGCSHSMTVPRMVKRAKRSVVGLLHEII